MKPIVFLSHSKKDKAFIEKIANAFHYCGIEVWYDEWEIPPGESLRRKIFEEGIPNCHVFFVYLTENSAESNWVKNELDSAFIHEIEIRNSFIVLYVNNESTRNQLPLDLKSRSIPVFNDTEYTIPLGKLISRTWAIYLKYVILENQKINDLKIIQLEKDKVELEKKLIQLQLNSTPDKEKIKKRLLSIKYSLNDITLTLWDILNNFKYFLADGCGDSELSYKLDIYFQEERKLHVWDAYGEKLSSKYHLPDFTGELIIQGIIEISKPNEQFGQLYYLTEFGKELLQ